MANDSVKRGKNVINKSHGVYLFIKNHGAAGQYVVNSPPMQWLCTPSILTCLAVTCFQLSFEMLQISSQIFSDHFTLISFNFPFALTLDTCKMKLAAYVGCCHKLLIFVVFAQNFNRACACKRRCHKLNYWSLAAFIRLEFCV